MPKPLYEILGAQESDDMDAIKKHHRRRVRECHPDKHPNDPEAVEKFKAVTEAFEVLGNPQLRIEYDKTGVVPKRGPTTNSQALSLLAKMVHAIIQGDLNALRKTSERELLKDMRELLERGMQEIDKKLIELVDTKRQLEDVAARFGPLDGEENALTAIVLAPLRDLNTTMAQVNNALAVHKEAYSILKKHKFHSKAKAKTASTSSATSTAWATTL